MPPRGRRLTLSPTSTLNPTPTLPLPRCPPAAAGSPSRWLTRKPTPTPAPLSPHTGERAASTARVPLREIVSPLREMAFPPSEIASPQREVASPKGQIASPKREIASHKRQIASHEREVASPRREVSSPLHRLLNFDGLDVEGRGESLTLALSRTLSRTLALSLEP